MRVSDLVDIVAQDLADFAPGDSFVHWSRKQIAGYLLEGIQLAYKERPDLFLERKVIEVTTENNPVETCDCDRIYRVLGQSTSSGRIINKLRRKDDIEDIWRGKRCPRDLNNFKLEEYFLDESTGTIELFPDIPGGTSVYIVVECSVLPDNLDESTEINSVIEPAVKQWALYSAKMTEDETNAAIMQAAQIHKATFWEILVAERRRVRIESEER